jgi:hypothetical protein
MFSLALTELTGGYLRPFVYNVMKRKDRGRVRVTLQLEAYRQSVRLGDKPLETHDK